MQDCNAVIFDLGGVILNIDYKATEKALRALLGTHAEAYYQQTKQSPLFDDLETGHIEPAAFRREVARLAGRALADQDIDHAWNAMLGDLPLERMKFVQATAKKRRIFLLSNTNAIHKSAFDQIMVQALKGQSFDAHFEKAYYSHLMGMRKPDPAIYTYVCVQHGLEPARTLFIDDNKENVAGARQAGLQAFHLEGELLNAAPLRFLL